MEFTYTDSFCCDSEQCNDRATITKHLLIIELSIDVPFIDEANCLSTKYVYINHKTRVFTSEFYTECQYNNASIRIFL